MTCRVVCVTAAVREGRPPTPASPQMSGGGVAAGGVSLSGAEIGVYPSEVFSNVWMLSATIETSWSISAAVMHRGGARRRTWWRA